MRAIYFQCVGGASGDMVLGALVDAGAPVADISRGLAPLFPQGIRLSARPAQRGVIHGTQVTVEADANPPLLGLNQVEVLVSGSSLPAPVVEKSLAVFRRLAEAEARVHHVALNEVAMVGRPDTIADIVGGVLGLHLLGVEAVYTSPLPAGSGTIDSLHGVLPVPPPAVMELVALARAPLRPTHYRTEQVTPTGAALLTTLASFEAPDIVVERIGYGAGSRHLPELPNVLALWLGQVSVDEERLVLLQTNIDDMSPQLHGYVMELLLGQGARDVWFTPIQMKKDRPGTMISVLATVDLEADLVATLFRETTTLGIRRLPVGRHEAERESFAFKSSLGPVSMKRKRFQGQVLGVAPEYEDCRRLAQKHGLPLQEVYRRLAREGGEAP
ncbi:MAG: nickel pincer cofactor biosynthesis protein LarC [Chloroflexi bacterium]|nr:nickel pincer cofactor biosynthesis protein LarC [Chloroflexota bacterium]